MVYYRLGMSKHEDTEGASLEGSQGKPMGKGMSEEKKVQAYTQRRPAFELQLCT